MIYVFLSVTILGSLLSISVAVYFSLRCQRARGEIPAEPLQEVVVISPAVGLQEPLVQAARDVHQQRELGLQHLPAQSV
jgi:hypothetical protein